MVELYYIVKDTFQGTYTSRVFGNFFELLWLVGPYFIASVLINVLLRQVFIKKSINFTTGRMWIDVLLAAIVGLISPFPTYIAVPMTLSLLIIGIQFRVIFAFMLASPLMNPGIFYLTWSQLGWEIAIARTCAAFLIAISGGFLLGHFIDNFSEKIKSAIKIPTLKNRSIWHESWRSIRYIGKYFLIALFLSAAVKSFIPIEMVSRFLGTNTSMSVITAMALGIPFYSCGGAAIPLIEILSEMGMNKGAVLAFFTAGPSTKLETLYVFKSAFGGYLVLIIYLVYSLLGAFLCGMIYLFI
jgi:uncharacterized membrane protein YraQ (UPF0718 family)